ncbi:4-hydroxy-3-methylbut-2-enyl diphosphate reductase [Candidatus Curtissbacteria bacterium]|nr:4-hydroxy-3-methylbut-2-enyl diphosphate reductase [Candidatus Curtissbacteria bacterium]
MSLERYGFDGDPRGEIPQFSVEKILVAGNRGPCAGVNMALEATSQVLDIVNGREPVFTNWPVVNNDPIMEELRAKGLVTFNNDWKKIENGSIVLFSAHGVTPQHHRIAQEKDCLIIDTTCLLVTAVHNLVKQAEGNKQGVVYIGRKDHPETVGVMSEVDPESIELIERKEDVDGLYLAPGKSWIVYSQTTLMPDEVDEVEDRLMQKFPEIEIPDKLGICYATYSRQRAVEGLIQSGIGALVVVGSQTSHNSQMLARRGERSGVPSVVVDYPNQLDPGWFTGVKMLGVTSGASVLDKFMEPVAEWVRIRSPKAVIEFQEQIKREPMDAMYPLPAESIAALKARFAS